MEQTLTLRRLWSIVRKRIGLILSFGIIAALCSWATATYLIPPTYEASRQIVINNSDPEQVMDYNAVMTNFQYANTYSDMIYSDVVLETVIDELGMKTTAKEFSKSIKVTSKKESQVITITAENSDYPMAVDTVNKLSTVFKDQVLQIMKVDNVELFPPTKAKPDPQPVHPKPILFAVVGLLTGIILGLTISVLLKVFSNTITSQSDIEQLFNIQVIGVVSKVKPSETPAKSDSQGQSVKLALNKGLGGRQVDR